MSAQEKPIIFKGEMVKAILEGRKTQTRRIVKPQPSGGFSITQDEDNQWGLLGTYEAIPGDPGSIEESWTPVWCPYDADRLWVREAWADVNTPDGPAICYRATKDYQSWHDFSETFGPDEGAGPSMDYDAYPGDYCMWWEDLLRGEPDHRWKPSIHMPRWACRLVLEVEEIRVERLQNISEDDVLAEGVGKDILPACGDHPDLRCYVTIPDDNHAYVSAREAFKTLWDSINKDRGSWEDNPYTWAVTFRKA